MGHDTDHIARSAYERLIGHPTVAPLLPHLGGRVAVVGGLVREALLGVVRDPDVDLVVEGDPSPVARRLAGGLDGELTEHPRFRTAEVRWPGGVVDLVGARRERYPVPGELPVVSPGSLAQDLARRDFTVNAMAIRLTGSDVGALVDPTGGRRDLADRVLRVLHAGSFRDDPSRLVRGARYAARYGLDPEPATDRLARGAAPWLDPGSARVVGELARLLDDEDAPEAIGILTAWGVPWIRRETRTLAVEIDRLDRACEELGIEVEPRWALRLALAAGDLERLTLPGPAREVAEAARAGLARGAALDPRATPSEVDRAVGDLPVAAAVAARAAGAESVAEWLRRERSRPLRIDGNDLIAAGVPAGPALGRGLAAARAAALDDPGLDVREQLRIARAAALERVL